MTTSILGTKLQETFDNVKSLLLRVIDLARKCDDQSATKIIHERLKTLNSAVLFVIVGEVKAGKSSFINALLAEDICEVAPNPCTAGIQEIVYGSKDENGQRISLGNHWERVSLDLEVLKSISIVDTPGTNSIIKNHQTITEQYIPQSDLVVFVFSAKNPHTNTAWELLEFIQQDWHRKTVFVLQQADLASPEELTTNIADVKRYAHERNVQDPIVFALSAKLENEGNSESRFSEFRDYLRKTIENGDVWNIKMQGAKDTARKISDQLLEQLKKTQSVMAMDRALLEDIKSKINLRRQKATKLRETTVDSICLTYEMLVGNLKQNFREGLTPGNILRRSVPLIRDKDIKQWLIDLQEQFGNNAESAIETAARSASKDLCNEISEFFEDLSQSIKSHQSNILAGGYFSKDRAEIFDTLKGQLDGLNIIDMVSNRVADSSKLAPLALAGGSIAVLGTAITLTTSLLVVDITGGILAATGVLLATATLLWKRKAILTDFDNDIDASETRFRNDLDAAIKNLFDKLFLQLDHRLEGSIRAIDLRIQNLAPLVNEAEDCRETVNGMIEGNKNIHSIAKQD